MLLQWDDIFVYAFKRASSDAWDKQQQQVHSQSDSNKSAFVYRSYK